MKIPLRKSGLPFGWEEDAPKQLHTFRASSLHLLAGNLLEKAEPILQPRQVCAHLQAWQDPLPQS